MEMETVKYLQILTEEIHSVVVATLNEEGRPETRVIDMMLYDEQGLYFLTARSKSFYRQLMQQGYVSLSGTKVTRAVRVDGRVRSIGHEKRNEIFAHNIWEKSIRAIRARCSRSSSYTKARVSSSISRISRISSAAALSLARRQTSRQAIRSAKPASAVGAACPSARKPALPWERMIALTSRTRTA